eukprot:TRINITY_DN5716_c0_g1_i1.p1 TRINITY_DN5716_c0_g1~~TRINITY_DN5716_c0_g1_i1.p1  ORF type:complete len:104 (-),score=7.98 TRINITY_DN5716_c0_g1_i1:473-784(-)
MMTLVKFVLAFAILYIQVETIKCGGQIDDTPTSTTSTTSQTDSGQGGSAGTAQTSECPGGSNCFRFTYKNFKGCLKRKARRKMSKVKKYIRNNDNSRLNRYRC